MFFVSLVLQFILKIRFRNKSVIQVTNQYGAEVRNIFRELEKCDFKNRKIVSDLDFLQKCATNYLFPNFLNFKLAQDKFRCDSDYKRYQRKLLFKGIDCKRLNLSILRESKDDYRRKLESRTSYLDFKHLMHVIDKTNDRKIDEVKFNKDRKLFNLGLRKKYDSLSPESVIFNLSERCLTDNQKEALSYGLSFSFNLLKLNYTNHFLAFENLYKQLASQTLYSSIPDALAYVRTRIKNAAFKSYYSFKSNVSDHHRNLIQSLKELSQDKDIIGTRPNNVKCMVFLNRSDHERKM